MKLSDAILAGIAGTTTFTLFSYIMTERTGKDYEQPELLGKMIDRTEIDLTKKESEYSGWLIHYLTGIIFATVYKKILDLSSIKPGIKNGAITGAITGLPAILGWHTLLYLHPNPPRKKSWDYYAELVAGHIIFGATCFWVFNKRMINASRKPFTDLKNNPQLSQGKLAFENMRK